MRIIDADRAKEIAEVSLGDIFLQTAVKLLIDKVPTIDAVPVVRCKDCKKWFRHTQVDRERGDCRRYETTKHETGYCDRGERRDNG